MTKAGPRCNWGDLSLASNGTDLLFRQRCSKTMQTGPTVLVPILATGDSLCPVKALMEYRALLSIEQLHPDKPILQNQDGSALTYKQASSRLKRTFTQSGLDPSGYSSHCFRIGQATEKASDGAPAELIRLAGRWRSNVYHRYIRPTETQLFSAAHLIEKSKTDTFQHKVSQPTVKKVKFLLGTKSD